MEKLNVLWTNADPITSEFMVLMYTKRTLEKKLWDSITVIIWGATANLVAENTHIQELVTEAMKVGVKFSACIACATELGVVEKINELGIELKSWGKPLTDIIKSKEKLITI